MVQEKDAALKRQQARLEFLEKKRKKIEDNTVRIKWQVIEHTPGYENYDDKWVQSKDVVVKDELKSEEEAQAWVDAHEPDPGKELRIKMRRLVRQVEYYWY